MQYVVIDLSKWKCFVNVLLKEIPQPNTPCSITF
jgi:hypothetical protein